MKRLIRNLATRQNSRRDILLNESYQEFSKESLSARRFYNVGAGLFGHPFWTNIDYATEHYRGIQKNDFIHYDLMELKPFPVESNKAELVYSSHTIEHVSDEAVRNMLKESYRILKPGGGIRLTTPDALLEFKAYRRNDIKYWYWTKQYDRPGSWEKQFNTSPAEASIHQLFLHHFASQLCEIDIDASPEKKFSDAEIMDVFSSKPEVETLDFFTKQCRFNSRYPGSHINWWTHGKIMSFLREAGFSDPYISGWGQSVFYSLRDTTLFDKTHPKISLYVEAIK